MTTANKITIVRILLVPLFVVEVFNYVVLGAFLFLAWSLIRDCVVTTGSFLGAWLWSVSPQANFVGASVFGALGTLWFWWLVYRRTVDGAD